MQTWTVIPVSQTPNHPVAREYHSSVSVYDPDSGPTHPALLIMWGDDGDEILRDGWIFHLNQQQWRKVVIASFHEKYVNLIWGQY